MSLYNVIYFHLKTLLNIGNHFRAHILKGKTYSNTNEACQ